MKEGRKEIKKKREKEERGRSNSCYHFSSSENENI
jgi:hypothetical protein